MVAGNNLLFAILPRTVYVQNSRISRSINPNILKNVERRKKKSLRCKILNADKGLLILVLLS